MIAITACGQLDIGYVVSGGVGVAWRAPANGPSGWTADAFKGCDVGDWHTPPADTAQAGRAPGVTLDSGLLGAVIGVQGDGAPPRVALTGPDGSKLAAPAAAEGIVRGDGYAFVHVPADETTYVLVAHPQAGRWTVQAQPGSAPVTGVRYADILPQPEVHASVAGRGRTRALTYDVKRIPGQVVTFREVGGGVVHTLGTARRSHDTIRFRPAFGPRAVRRIAADVEQNDLPRAAPEVARYVSPKRALRRIALRRRGERLAIGWSPVAGASGYAVEVRTGDGRALGYQVEPGTPRRVVVRHLYDPRPSRVTVRALRPDGVAGQARTVRGGR